MMFVYGRVWLLSGMQEASVCLKRHYYVTEEEKLEMIGRRQRKELVLEMAILRRICEREMVLQEVRPPSCVWEGWSTVTITLHYRAFGVVGAEGMLRLSL